MSSAETVRAVLLAMWALLLFAAPEPASGADLKTRNVILVTLDGVRIQEIFGGLDEAIAAHDAKAVYSEIATGRERYGGSTPQARREALMPFFWQQLAPQGIVLGNIAFDNHVKVQNGVLWSEPGYAELMTGRPQPEVMDNDAGRIPHPSALDVAQTGLGLGFSQVAEFGSWDGYATAASSKEDSFVMVGGFNSVRPDVTTPEIDYLAGLRGQVMELWSEGSNDVLTFRMAKAYLVAQQPRVLWIALVNSDDWAHADRYDRYLEYLHLADSLLADLWNTVQSLDAYRDQTSLIITTDHGRGLTADDWKEHDAAIPGSDDIWIAVIGPDTPDTGEVTASGTAVQGQVAATLLQLLGLDYRLLSEEANPPIGLALPPASH